MKTNIRAVWGRYRCMGPGLGLVALLAISAQAQTDVIGVNFVGGGGTLAGGDSAGIVPALNWNNESGSSGSGITGLVYSNAATVSGLSLSYSAPGAWNNGWGTTDGDHTMLRGYLDDNSGQGGAGQSITVTCSGLPYGRYNVYVYSDGDNSNQGEIGRYRVYSGAGTGGTVLGEFWMLDPVSSGYRGFVKATTTSWSGDANTAYATAIGQVNSATYAQFLNISESTITIEALAVWCKFANDSQGWKRAPINGIQIEAVSAIPTTTTLGSSLNPSQAGDNVTFTAIVKTNGVTATDATGNVVFKDGATPLSTNALSNGTVSYSTSALSFGWHALTAQYLGDASYNPSTSSDLSQLVTTQTGGVGVNFVGGAGGNGTLGGADSAGAAAQVNWNNATGGSGSGIGGLVNDVGTTVSGLSLSYTSAGPWNNGYGTADGDRKLFNGYLDTGGNPGDAGQSATVTLVNVPYASYNLCVYSDGDNGTQGEIGRYRVYSGVGTGGAVLGEFWVLNPADSNYRGLVQAITTSWNGDADTAYATATGQVNNATYVQFSDLTAATITIESLAVWCKFANDSQGWKRAPINAVQVQAHVAAPHGTLFVIY